MQRRDHPHPEDHSSLITSDDDDESLSKSYRESMLSLKLCLKHLNHLEVLGRRHRVFTSSFLLLLLLLLICLLVFGHRMRIDHRGVFTASGGIHSPILYGHVHMAKTGGTSLNGILANKFEHVCGHKGYSYDAYQDNERHKEGSGAAPAILKGGESWSRSRVNPDSMNAIGYEDCDYISHESNWQFWANHFGGEEGFHGVKMELHVPCRDRIEHLMSMCNYQEPKQKLACNAKTDEELFESVKKCFLFLGRYDHELLNLFNVKCFDFDKQFTGYVQYMSNHLNKRRFESIPYIKRETNDPRHRDQECIWENSIVLEKVDQYLLDTVPYYQFCDSCMGSEHEIPLPG